MAQTHISFDSYAELYSLGRGEMRRNTRNVNQTQVKLKPKCKFRRFLRPDHGKIILTVSLQVFNSARSPSSFVIFIVKIWSVTSPELVFLRMYDKKYVVYATYEGKK